MLLSKHVWENIGVGIFSWSAQLKIIPIMVKQSGNRSVTKNTLGNIEHHGQALIPEVQKYLTSARITGE